MNELHADRWQPRPPMPTPMLMCTALPTPDDRQRREGSPTQQGAKVYIDALRTAGGRLVDARLGQHRPSAVGVALYAAPPYKLDVPALPVSRLIVTLTAARISGGLEGERPQVFQSPRYALFHAPAGAAAHWHKEAPSRHLTLYFDADVLTDGGIGRNVFAQDDEPLLNVSMPGIRPLVDELLAEIENSHCGSAEAVDSLGRLLLIKVARRRARQNAAANPLTPALLARLTEYAQAHLSERILVSDLAAAVGLSPGRFAQAFVGCTGQSPHQFMIAVRLRQAQSLLRTDRATLADVAAACGFASQQHLTQVMRKRLGVTPARYRLDQGLGLHGPVLRHAQPLSDNLQTSAASG